MGFLDREKARLYREAQAKMDVANREATARQRKAAMAAAAQADREDLKLLGQSDDASIRDILTNLPSGISELLEAVRKNSRFGYDVAVYTRTNKYELDLEKDMKSAGLPVRGAKQDEKYSAELVDCDGNVFDYESRIRTPLTPMHVLLPSAMYFGDKILGMAWSFLSKPQPEPQEPGIGVRFSREVGSKTKSLPQSYDFDVTTTYDSAYLRFVAPRTAFITGLGKSIEVRSLHLLDAALAEGLERTFRTQTIHREQGYRPTYFPGGVG